MFQRSFDFMPEGEKKYYTYFTGRKVYPVDKNFEPVMYSRDVENIGEERYNYIVDLTNSFRKLFASNKQVPFDRIDDFTLGEKYSYIIRILKNNLEHLKMFNKEKISFESEAEKHLLIALFTDPKCNYMGFYNYLRNENKDNKEIQNIIKETCGFYSNKLLMLELYFQKLQLNLSEKKLEEDTTKEQKKI